MTANHTTPFSVLRFAVSFSEPFVWAAFTKGQALYDRHDYLREKAEALEAWATLLRDILDPSSNVVRLRS